MAKFTATLKAGRDFDSPWIIVKADTAVALKAALTELEDTYLLQIASRVSMRLQRAYKYEQER